MDSPPTVKRDYSQLDETELEKEYIRLKEELKPIEKEMKKRHIDNETNLILDFIGLSENVRKYIGDITTSVREEYVGKTADEISYRICFRIDRLWVCVSDVSVGVDNTSYIGCGIRLYNADKRLFYALERYEEESTFSLDACYLLNDSIYDDDHPKNMRCKTVEEAKEKVLELTSNVDDSLRIIRNVIVACFRRLGQDSDEWHGIATSCAQEETGIYNFEYLLGIPHEWDEETKRIGGRVGK